MDWTDANDGLYETRPLSPNVRGRAIPILWRTGWEKGLRGRQNHVAEELPRTLSRIAPLGLKMGMLADRGFARMGLFHLGNDSGLNFIVRVRRWVGAYRKSRDGVWYSFRPRKGTRHDFGLVDFRDRDPYRVRLVLIYDRGQREPWFLASGLQEAQDRIVAGYARRMEIDESFKDI